MSGSTLKPESLIPRWQLEENAARTEAYRKNLEDEAFLFRFNEILEPLEHSLQPDGEARPIFLFFGLPRCGKTFFSQAVNYCFDLGYPNNLAARFWRAPVHGMRLAEIVGVTEIETDFSSDYGKTGSLSDPHDFHYFWQHWFRMDRYPHDPAAKSSEIDWPGLGRQLHRMSGFWGRPGLMKAIEASFHMREVVAAYPRAVFVFLRRDLIDSAASLLKGRRDNFGSADAWYGQVPPPADFERLRQLPWHEQIGGQFRALLDMYESQLAELPAENVLRLDYRALCDDPESTMAALAERSRVFGTALTPRRSIDPGEIRFSRGRGDASDLDLLRQGLARFNLPERFD